MNYDILHELPGRMRVHCHGPTLNPDCRIELKRWVSQHSELLCASISTRTGNLLLTYSRDVSREAVLLIMDDLRIFGVANIAPGREIRETSLAQTAAGACLKTVAGAVIKAVMPRPLRKIRAGWLLARALIGLAGRLGDGQTVAFAYGLCKCAFMALFATSLPARLLCAAGFAVLEKISPWLTPEPASSRRAPEPARLAMSRAAG